VRERLSEPGQELPLLREPGSKRVRLSAKAASQDDRLGKQTGRGTRALRRHAAGQRGLSGERDADLVEKPLIAKLRSARRRQPRIRFTAGRAPVIGRYGIRTSRAQHHRPADTAQVLVHPVQRNSLAAIRIGRSWLDARNVRDVDAVTLRGRARRVIDGVSPQNQRLSRTTQQAL
jgi:hypothetical protein